MFKRKIYTIFLNCINLSLNLVRNRLYCSWSKYQIKTQPSTKYLIIVFILWNGYVSSKIQRVFCTIWIFASMVYVRTPFFIWECPNPKFFFEVVYTGFMYWRASQSAWLLIRMCQKSDCVYFWQKVKQNHIVILSYFFFFDTHFYGLKHKKGTHARSTFFVF